MPFVTGEVEAREQAPWAYDAVNDMLKQGPLYLAAAGLFAGIRYTNNNLAGFTQTTAVGGAFLLVPAGKRLLITDFWASSVSGTVQSELLVGASTIGAGLINPVGGSNSIHLVVPLVIEAGSTVSFQVNPLAGAATFFAVEAHGILL